MVYSITYRMPWKLLKPLLIYKIDKVLVFIFFHNYELVDVFKVIMFTETTPFGLLTWIVK